MNFVFKILVIMLYVSTAAGQNPAPGNEINSKIDHRTPSIPLYNFLINTAAGFIATNADSAVHLNKKALQVARDLKLDSLIANSSYAIASTEAARSHYDSALKYCDTAFKYFNNSAKKLPLAMVRNVQGGVYMATGRNELAVKMYFESVDYTKEDTASNRILYTYHNIVLLLNNMGRYTEAISFASRQFKVASGLNISDEIAYAAGNMSETYLHLKDSAGARNYIHIFLNSVKNTADPYLNMMRYNQIALLHYLDKEYSKAITNFYHSLKLNESLSDKQLQCITLLSLGKTFQQVDRTAQSDSCFQRVIKLSDELNLKYEKKEAYDLLITNASKSGDFEKAYSYLLQLALLKDSLLNEKGQNALIDAQTKFNTLEQRQQIDFLNMEKMLQQSDIKRQKGQKYAILTAAVIALILIALFFNRYKLKQKILEQQALLNERTRIGRELHDDMGGGLSTIRLMTEMLKEQKFGLDLSYLNNISDKSKELVQNMNEIVWSLNNNNDTIQGLISYIQQYAKQFIQDAGIELEFKETVADNQFPVSGISRRHIFLIVKEALNNIVKHAESSKVTIDIAIENDLSICIKDNGKGFSPDDTRNGFGNGMNNMRTRAELLNGVLKVERDHGTIISILIPVSKLSTTKV